MRLIINITDEDGELLERRHIVTTRFEQYERRQRRMVFAQTILDLIGHRFDVVEEDDDE